MLPDGHVGDEWDALALHNAEGIRGIRHSPETEAFMASEQARYDAQRERMLESEGFVRLGDNGWIKAPA